MQNIILFLLLVFVICEGCGQSQNNSEQLINIDKIAAYPEKALPISVSAVFNDIEYIPLSFDDENIILSFNDIIKIEYNGNNFYIFEIGSNSERTIYSFNKSGALNFKIISPREGPGSFPTANDFNLNENSIEILERYKQKIVTYDLDGNLLHEKSTSNPYFQFVKFKEGGYGFYSGNEIYSQTKFENIHLANKEGKLINSFLPIKPYLKDFTFLDLNFSSTDNNNSYLFTEILNDTIYRITEQIFEPKFIVHTGHWIDEETILQMSKKETIIDKHTILNDGNHIINFNKVIEWEHFLFFTFAYKKDFFWNFYDKKTKNNKLFNLGKINSTKEFNDLDGGLKLTVPLTYNKGEVVFLLHPFFLSKYKNNFANNTANPYQFFMPRLKEDGNPVIAVAKLKESYQ